MISRTKSWHWIRWMIALGLAGGAVFWWIVAEPSYRGKPLSFWITWADTAVNDSDRAPALEAIHQMGKPALRRLVNRWLADGQQSRFEKVIETLRSKLPQQWPKQSKDNGPSAHQIPLLIQRIGPKASWIIPMVLPELNSGVLARQQRALWLLSVAGSETELVSPLLSVYLKSADPNLRQTALTGFAQGIPPPPHLVPHLTELLSDQENRTRAMQALGNAGPAAKSAIPHLRPLINGPDIHSSLQACAALWQIDQDPVALNLLIDALDNGSNELRSAAASILEHRPISDRKLLEPLLTALADDSFSSWESAALALRRVDPGNRRVIPLLYKKLLQQRHAFGTPAKLILDFDPTEPQTIQLLLQSQWAFHAEDQLEAARILAAATPQSAVEVIPVLAKMLGAPEARHREPAEFLLEKIAFKASSNER
ncbi:MAG: HEAT repeat domain-containing protein [Verrucomicrobiota bacterium]